MPSARVMRSGAKISSAPSPKLNQPRLRAMRSEALNELGPVLTTFGSLFRRAMFQTFSITMFISSGSVSWLGFENDLDAAVLLVAEHLVHLRPFIEPRRVRDDKGWIDVAFLYEAQQLVGPAVDVSLSGADSQSFVHQLPH